MAHRISYMLNRGAIPSGLLVLHKCDNPPCVNPDHLFLGTHQDNATDRDSKGRMADMRGEKNPFSKLKDVDVCNIRAILKYVTRRGVITELARIYDVSVSTISLIKLNKSRVV